MECLTAQEQTVLAYIDSHREEMLALWERLVCSESPSGDKEGVDRVGKLLAEALKQSGAVVRFVSNEVRGDVLCADWRPENPGKPIVFCGHMDTVFPLGTLAERPFRIESGKAFGPGVLDMKGGLVILVFVLRALREADYRLHPIRVILAPDEEIGHTRSCTKDTLLRYAAGAAAAFNFETGFPDGGIVVSRKGTCRFLFDVDGVEAHSGNCPEKGRNAIEEMAHKILALQALNDLPHGTSVNVGVISGGTVVNAVPGHCRIEVDVRYTSPALLDALLVRAREISDTVFVDGCSCTMTLQKTDLVMEESEAGLALFRQVGRAAERIGASPLKPIRSGGWSDSNLISSLGVPVVCAMGVCGEHNHTAHEYAIVDSLFERAKLAAVSILGLQ